MIIVIRLKKYKIELSNYLSTFYNRFNYFRINILMSGNRDLSQKFLFSRKCNETLVLGNIKKNSDLLPLYQFTAL